MKLATIPHVKSIVAVCMRLTVFSTLIKLTTQTLRVISMRIRVLFVVLAYTEPVISKRATPILRLVGRCSFFTMNSGRTNSARSVAAFMQAFARKKAKISIQVPVVMLKSHNFSIGRHTHTKQIAAKRL